MQVDITSLQRAETGESVEFESAGDKPKVADLPGLQITSLTGQVSQLGNHLLATGAVQGSVELTCSRCTCAYQQKVQAEFSDEYAEDPTEDQYQHDGRMIDLTPAVRAALLLQLPSQPIHHADCKGLCDVCGKDLNTDPHEHEAKDDQSHPFAALKKLKK